MHFAYRKNIPSFCGCLENKGRMDLTSVLFDTYWFERWGFAIQGCCGCSVPGEEGVGLQQLESVTSATGGMNLPGQRLRVRVLSSWSFSFAHHLFPSAMVHSFSSPLPQHSF